VKYMYKTQNTSSDCKMLNTPIEHCSVPFLGLTEQTCGDLCGSATGFDFLTVKVIEIEKKALFSQCLDLCQWSVACSIPGRILNTLGCCKT
jgi:hypothetical protein